MNLTNTAGVDKTDRPLVKEVADAGRQILGAQLT